MKLENTTGSYLGHKGQLLFGELQYNKSNYTNRIMDKMLSLKEFKYYYKNSMNTLFHCKFI